MSVIEIIRESESECAEPCKVGEWREARISEREAADAEKRLQGKAMAQWIASVVADGNKRKLRYTKRG